MDGLKHEPMKLPMAVGAFSSLAINARPVAKGYKNTSYRRPDHPSFQQKRHSMIVDAQGGGDREIKTESGTLKFESGVAVLPDDTRAKDVYDELNAKHARHPNQFMLSEKRGTVNVNEIHRMRITSPGMPWATYDELGRRVYDSETEDENGRSEVGSGNHPDTA